MSDPSAFSIGDVEIIMEVGAEGGSIAVPRRAGNPPSFAMRLVDQSLLMLDEGPEVQSKTDWGSWKSAVAALERYPWRMLYPLNVHQGFAQTVLDLVAERASEVDERSLGKWAQVCGGPSMRSD